MSRSLLILLLLAVALPAWAGDVRVAGRPPASHTFCDVRDTPTTQDEYMARIAVGGTLQRVWCIATGTIGTAATVTIQECASDGTGCAQNQTATISCDADGDTTATFGGAAGAVIDADDWIRRDITNTSTTTGRLTTCFRYVEN